MRNQSFFLTQRQIREQLKQLKTVTRRLGSHTARIGELRQPIVKGQGLKKGEKVSRIGGPIRYINVRREALAAMLHEPYGSIEAALEGFPEMTGAEFVAMFMKHNVGRRANPEHVLVTRIEFEYTEPKS